MGTEYLAKYGILTIDNGYDICFIRPGKKRPFGDEWQKKRFGPKSIAKAIGDGRGDFGVGIRTDKTPGVDIDCYDAEIVDKVKAFTIELLGETLERVGMAPKTLLVYRAPDSFPKTQSKVFLDNEGRPVKLEVLANGQQFVGFHIHPDTENPYRWKDKRHPANVPAADLPEITQDDALEIVAYFEKLAEEAGWAVKPGHANALARRSAGGEYDMDDAFVTDASKVELSAEEIRAKLDLVPNPEDYDQWFFVGMALYHQFGGSQEGLLMWHEWSTQAQNYDQDALDEKWPTFEIEGKRRQPLTARYILKQAKAEEERLSTVEMDEIKNDLANVGDMADVRRICDHIKQTAFDTLQREILAQDLQKQILKATKAKLSITAVRQMIRYENPEHTKIPAWLSGFVYVQFTESFYHPQTRVHLTTKAFDQSFARYMMTKKDRLEGRSSPEHAPSHVALNRYEIDTVHRVMYLPEQPDIFEIGGVRYVNGFDEATLPDTDEELDRRGKRMVALLERHMEHLFAHERDRKLLLSWMAYIVQTNKRSNWCPIIQGAEGDGKTTLATVLYACLGPLNIATINGDSLAEKYTPWAQGTLFCFIEEVRLHGTNRFDVINKMKPYISNDLVPIRVMQKDTYNVVNTVNYMMGTNFKDGVPINENDTRYFPVFSNWQTAAALSMFKEANPTYYSELAELQRYGSALRRYLLDYKLHPEFDPKRRAPPSADRQELLALNKSEADEVLDALLEKDDDPLLCPALLDSSSLSEAMEPHDATPPYGRALNSWLSEKGFAYLGRHWVDGKPRRLWTQEPKRFKDKKTGGISLPAVRRYLAHGGDSI